MNMEFVAVLELRVGVNHCIRWNRDEHADRIMQVPLNGDDEYTGGRRFIPRARYLF